jgi:hypothetical protein
MKFRIGCVVVGFLLSSITVERQGITLLAEALPRGLPGDEVTL